MDLHDAKFIWSLIEIDDISSCAQTAASQCLHAIHIQAITRRNHKMAHLFIHCRIIHSKFQSLLRIVLPKSEELKIIVLVSECFRTFHYYHELNIF